uniref:Uncharacterized protein n=1 Tax=Glossina palpalis gambiensis TaxID=67801 RepID=A0A1B0AKI4_9MUSC
PSSSGGGGGKAASVSPSVLASAAVSPSAAFVSPAAAGALTSCFAGSGSVAVVSVSSNPHGSSSSAISKYRFMQTCVISSAAFQNTEISIFDNNFSEYPIHTLPEPDGKLRLVLKKANTIIYPVITQFKADKSISLANDFDRNLHTCNRVDRPWIENPSFLIISVMNLFFIFKYENHIQFEKMFDDIYIQILEMENSLNFAGTLLSESIFEWELKMCRIEMSEL